MGPSSSKPPPNGPKIINLDPPRSNTPSNNPVGTNSRHIVKAKKMSVGTWEARYVKNVIKIFGHVIKSETHFKGDRIIPDEKAPPRKVLRYFLHHSKKSLTKLISQGRNPLTQAYRQFARNIPMAWGYAGSGALLWKGLADYGAATFTSTNALAAGKIGASFLGGALVGIGLEKSQQYLFGNSISGLAGDWAYERIGPPDKSTINWFDKYFGWLP